MNEHNRFVIFLYIFVYRDLLSTQVNAGVVLCHEIRSLPAWHADMFYDDRKLWVDAGLSSSDMGISITDINNQDLNALLEIRMIKHDYVYVHTYTHVCLVCTYV